MWSCPPHSSSLKHTVAFSQLLVWRYWAERLGQLSPGNQRQKREPGTNPEDVPGLTASRRDSYKEHCEATTHSPVFSNPFTTDAPVWTEDIRREDDPPPLFLEQALTSLPMFNLTFLPPSLHDATWTELLLNSDVLQTITSFGNTRPRIHWPRIKRRPHCVISKASNDLAPTYFTFLLRTPSLISDCKGRKRWFSDGLPWPSSRSITWDLTRNAHQAQTKWTGANSGGGPGHLNFIKPSG